MRAHRRFGPVRVASLNALVDGAVRLVSGLFLARSRQRDYALLLEPFRHLVVQGEEDRVARDAGDLEMEGDVCVGEALAVSYRFTVRFQRRLQRFEVLPGCAARRL